MSSTSVDYIDTAKWVIGVTVPIVFTVGIMWWKGVFEKIKEKGTQEIQQVKKEASLEQTDAVYDYLLKNITDRVKSIENNHTNMLEKVSDLKEDVAVMKRDIDHLVDSVDRLSRNINDGTVRRR